MLIGFVVPSDFARTSRIPPSSRTARTPPPAMTPVPGEAGRRRTRAASNLPSDSCVIVCPCFGTVNMFFFASSTAFEIASGTSRALPYAAPTLSTSSPITTRAVNENRRPPLTTFATRLISTTRSLSSRLSSRSMTARSTLVNSGLVDTLKVDSSLAYGVGECLDASVVQVTGAVEHDGFDVLLAGVPREEPADFGSLGLLVAGTGPLHLEPARRRKRFALGVVDDLRDDAAVRACDDEARPLGRSLHPAAHALVPSQTRFSDGKSHYARFPTLRRT